MKAALLEICVDSLESALAAQEGGADRLELCANLILGGTWPSMALVRQVLDAVQIPVRVLLRPRFGDFCLTPAEKQETLCKVEMCRQLGVDGVVLGALTEDGDLDVAFLRQCLEAAGPALGRTLHRAFDLCRDPGRSLEEAIELGFDTLLTSGQQATALQGAPMLRRLVQQAAGRIQILAGSGVLPEHMAQLAETGVRKFRFSAKQAVDSPMRFRRPGVPMGLPLADEYTRQYASSRLAGGQHPGGAGRAFCASAGELKQKPRRSICAAARDA